MADSEHHKDLLPPQVHEVIRVLISSLRASRTYPENNPVHLQSIQKTIEALSRHFQEQPALMLSVQKIDFLFEGVPVGRGLSLYRNLAADLFAKGVRAITFKNGIDEDELRSLFRILSIPAEEIRLRNSIKALIWEAGLSHVEVLEAELGEIVTEAAGRQAAGAETGGEAMSRDELNRLIAGRAIDLYGRKVLLSDVVTDPSRFGSLMVEMAKSASDSPRLQESRLFDLYRDVGRQILHTSHEERRQLFNSLAESVLSMDGPYREGLISGKLYHGMDVDTVKSSAGSAADHVPNDLHELLSGRFSKAWTVPDVSTLLEKSATAQFEPVAAMPERAELPADLHGIAKEMAEYTPAEMDSLKALGEYTRESVVVEAVVRTLIYLLPQVRNPYLAVSDDKNLSLFSGVVGQLEDMLHLLLERKDFAAALLILRAFRLPVEPLFQHRLTDAIKRAGERTVITRLLEDLRTFPKNAPEYQAVSAYLTLLDREVTPVLLELLAEEQDRSLRNLMIRILKELGKNQLAIIGERLSDERWYFVRNIVTILGESRREDVVGYLEKVAGHKNFQIRQEVVRALLSIRGERAARLLISYLRDRDVDIRFMAVRGLGLSPGSGVREEQALIDFVKGGMFRKLEPELKLEAIASLGKVGGPAAAVFLRRFTVIKWWRSRKTQESLRAAAEKALADIGRRAGNAGRAR